MKVHNCNLEVTYHDLITIAKKIYTIEINVCILRSLADSEI